MPRSAFGRVRDGRTLSRASMQPTPDRRASRGALNLDPLKDTGDSGAVLAISTSILKAF